MFLICNRLFFKGINVFEAVVRRPVRKMNAPPDWAPGLGVDVEPESILRPNRAQTNAR